MARHPTSQDPPLAVRPPFRAFMRAIVLLLGAALLALFATMLILGLARHKPLPSLAGVGAWWGVGVLLLPVVLGCLLWVLALPWSCTLSRDGVSGRSFVGRRQAIRYEDVGSLWVYANGGFPLLYINSRCRRREIVMYLTGVDRSALHGALERLAGPHHLLTREFAKTGTG
jgi:hypothetical protein